MIDSPEHRIARHARRIALEMALEDLLKTHNWYATYGIHVLGWRDWAAQNRAEVRRVIRLLRKERGR